MTTITTARGITPPVLVAVVTAAGRVCECTGRGCHGSGGGCERGMPVHRLIAAPRDPSIPDHAAWRVPLAELAAWCERCYDHARTQARAARKAALRAELLGDLALFTVSTTKGDPR